MVKENAGENLKAEGVPGKGDPAGDLQGRRSVTRNPQDTRMWVLSVLLSVTAFVILFLRTDLIYVINDDWGLYDVLSGTYLGSPDPHVSFMECPISSLIAGLYSLWGDLPWYGIFLESCVLISAVILCRGGIAMFPVFLAMAVPVICRPQYTTVAGILMAVSVYLILKPGRTRRETVLSALIAAAAEGIRPEMFLMFGAFIVPVCLLKVLVSEKKKDMFLYYLIPAGGITALLLLSLLSSSLMYSDPAWKSFRHIDRMRVSMADYYGYPDYGSHEEEFQKAGIDRADLELIASGTMYAGRYLSEDQWRVVRDAAKSDSSEGDTLPLRFSRMPSEFAKLLTDRAVLPCTCAAVVLSIFAIASGCIRDTAFSLFSFILTYGIMAYRGRVLDRVQIPLLSMYICAVAAFLFFGSFTEKSRRFKITAYITAAVLLFPSLKMYHNVRAYRVSDMDNLAVWQGIREYCESNGDSLYLLSAGSQTLYYYRERVLEPGPYANENFMYLGSGHMMNPNTTLKQEKLGYSDLLSDSV
ncbi:MAG: hypothetical protein K6E33_01770, partial [Lachnospiraceae bacterium]|nr:hypothetical protein [Lachnospiraceae bacterium]